MVKAALHIVASEAISGRSEITRWLKASFLFASGSSFPSQSRALQGLKAMPGTQVASGPCSPYGPISAFHPYLSGWLGQGPPSPGPRRGPLTRDLAARAQGRLAKVRGVLMHTARPGGLSSASLD